MEEKTANQPRVCILPPTRGNPARVAGATLGHPDRVHPGPHGPPRAQPARTWGPAARGGAERTVQRQQAGQQRAEWSHVAALGRGLGKRPSPKSQAEGGEARVRPGLSEHRLAAAATASAASPPSCFPPACSGSPARRRRLDRWLRAREAAGWRAGPLTRQRPRCQLPAGRSARPRNDAPGLRGSRATGRRDGPGVGTLGGAGPGAGRSWGAGRPGGGARGWGVQLPAAGDRKCHAETEQGFLAHGPIVPSDAWDPRSGGPKPLSMAAPPPFLAAGPALCFCSRAGSPRGVRLYLGVWWTVNLPVEGDSLFLSLWS